MRATLVWRGWDLVDVEWHWLRVRAELLRRRSVEAAAEPGAPSEIPWKATHSEVELAEEPEDGFGFTAGRRTCTEDVGNAASPDPRARVVHARSR